MWLDNVYMRMAFTSASEKPREKLLPSLTGLAPLDSVNLQQGTGEYYVTRTTFQGDGVSSVVGIWADESTYVESTSLLLFKLC